MATYLPGPDSGNNCCDCVRASPCDDCTATGACCISGVCSQATSSDCANAGGIYIGDGVPCDPYPCGACCYESGGIFYRLKHSFGEFHSNPGFPFNKVDVTNNLYEYHAWDDATCTGPTTCFGNCHSNVCT